MLEKIISLRADHFESTECVEYVPSTVSSKCHCGAISAPEVSVGNESFATTLAGSDFNNLGRRMELLICYKSDPCSAC